jgi:signal transduction histidine kinase
MHAKALTGLTGGRIPWRQGQSETAVVATLRRSRGSNPALEYVGRVVALGVVYFVTAKLGTGLASLSVVSAIWPAAGVALAGLVFFGPGAWPGIAVGGFLEVASQGVPIPVALGVAVGQTVAPVAAIVLLRAVGFDAGLRRTVDVLALVLIGGFASNVVTALIGPSFLLAGGFLTSGDWPLGAFVWWVGDVIGVLTVAPLVLLLPRSAGVGAAGEGRGGETILVLVATGAACALLFRTSLPLVFLIFPFALWAALRLGIRGAAAANLVVAGVAVWTTVQGRGPFADLPVTLRLVSLQSFNASVVIASLLLAALVNERKLALDDVRDSRARLLEAADAERRRLERDLHDGAQQRLLALSSTLGLARVRAHRGVVDQQLEQTLAAAVEDLKSAQAELRSLARGIHPVALTQQGLSAALESLAEQSAIPIDIAAPACRYAPVVEATAYFIVCEAVTNVIKHAQATKATVNVRHGNGILVVEVTDDGIGGADSRLGSGLTGLCDRASALGGAVSIGSQAGKGTLLRAELPCDWS